MPGEDGGSCSIRSCSTLGYSYLNEVHLQYIKPFCHILDMAATVLNLFASLPSLDALYAPIDVSYRLVYMVFGMYTHMDWCYYISRRNAPIHVVPWISRLRYYTLYQHNARVVVAKITAIREAQARTLSP